MRHTLILFLAVSVFMLTSCGENSTFHNKPVLDNKLVSDDGGVSDGGSIRVRTGEEIKDEALETDWTGNVDDAAYREYLDSLQYLDEMEEKISEAATTIDMLDTIGDAYEAWDKELNRIYALLMEKLSAEQREELKITQRLWIKERDKSASQYADSFEGGSFSQAAYNDILLQFTEERTLELVSIYFNDSDDFSFNLSWDGGQTEETQSESVLKPAVFHVYDINKHYYGENASFLELDLKLPRLEGDYDGIPAINEYFAEKEPYFYEQLPWDMLERLDASAAIEGKKDGYFVSAYYYLETQIGDIISIPAVLDGGAGGVSWAGMEGNAFNLNTGEKIELSDVFRVPEEEYLDYIYDYVSKQFTFCFL